MTREYVRFSVSVPEELNEDFENLRNRLNMSRSDAIRKGMRLFILDKDEAISETDTRVVLGTISYVEKAHVHSHAHDHADSEISHTHSSNDKLHHHVHSSEKENDKNNDDNNHNEIKESSPQDSYYFPVEQLEFIRINDLQHDFLHEIISTTHIHAGPNKCMIIIAVKGQMCRIKQLLDGLTAFRTIESLQFTPLEVL